jgi:hypothetical protein
MKNIYFSKELGHYLTGLIEGDRCVWTPKIQRSLTEKEIIEIQYMYNSMNNVRRSYNWNPLNNIKGKAARGEASDLLNRDIFILGVRFSSLPIK